MDPWFRRGHKQMDVYCNAITKQLEREQQALKKVQSNIQQHEQEIERLKEVEHEKQQLEKKWDELRLKHSQLEQQEKDLRMKLALDAYEQLCLNVGSEGRSSMRHLMVNLCQAEFERNFEMEMMMKAKSKKIAQADKELKNELESLFEKEYQFAKTRAQGNIWMIGELYNYGILSDNMIMYFMSRLLDELTEQAWCWLCELVISVRTSLVKNQVVVDKHFRRIKQVLKGKKQLSGSSETMLQQIIVDWEAKIDPGNVEEVEEKLPKSEPVAHKPVLYTVQNSNTSEPVGAVRQIREVNRPPQRGKSRGRYRGFANGSYPTYNSQHRNAAYSGLMPAGGAADVYYDWYEQNMYSLPKTRPFYDSYMQHNTRPSRPEVVSDVRGDQRMKRKPRQQQQQTQVNSVIKKELLDGEMKLGFRKQPEKPQEELLDGEMKLGFRKRVEKPQEETRKAAPKPDNAVAGCSSSKKLLSALCVDSNGEDEEVAHSPTTAKQVPAASESSSTQNDDDDDADVLIVSETVTGEEVVKSGPHNLSAEYSSGNSEYSSPMESPVPCDKSSEIWTRLALLPKPTDDDAQD